MSEGMQMARAKSLATQLDDDDFRFLRELAKWEHIASPRELGPQIHQAQNKARQKCKRKGIVTFESGYWRTTDIGRRVLCVGN
jgi:hypothetical protein